MLRKIAMLAVIASTFTLAGCFKTGIPEVDAVIEKGQQATQKACGFVPYVETILAALNAMTGGKTPTGSQYTLAAQKICAAAMTGPTSAVTLMAARSTVGVPMVVINGQSIPVRGYFVR